MASAMQPQLYDHERASLESWAASCDAHATVLGSALAKLVDDRCRKGGITAHAPALDEALSRLATSASVVTYQPGSLDDTQAFLIQVEPFLLPNALRLVVTFEGWLLWVYHGAPPALLQPIADDLSAFVGPISRRPRAPAWMLTSWGLARSRPGTSIQRLRDEAALLEARFQLARYARVDVSVPGVA